MKKILTASFAILTLGSAYAMPTDSGEHTYSAQGPAVQVHIQPRVRNIPAPSSWTPPERIPSAHVTYVKRDQPKKLGGGFSFSSPQFSTPAFSNPAFSNPNFSAPAFSNTNFSNPNFSNPQFSNPQYSNANYSNANYSNPQFSAPATR
ncbi:pentapeptide repeat-containing protein [bacterium]|nr:pentapeptide repeat-containing protein [bacterium]